MTYYEDLILTVVKVVQVVFLHLSRFLGIVTFTGRLRPEVQTLMLKYINFYQNGSPFIYPEQNCTLSYISRISQNNRISHNRHVFPGLLVVLVQVLKGCKLLCVSGRHFCQNLAPLDILRLSHHFFHSAADFVTLSYTKMAIFPTLYYIASLKKAPLSGGASPCRTL